MARVRLPADKADVSGAASKNPQRHRGRAKPKGTRPVGEPYARMSELQCEYWREFVAEMPWLNASHRKLLHMACLLSARIDEDDAPISAIQALSPILSKLGATPVDETKVSGGKQGDGEEDPADEFFGTRH